MFAALHNLPPLITMPKLRKRMNNKLYSCLLTHGPTSGIRTQAILVGGKWSHHCTSLACSNEHVCIFKKCVKWLEIRPRPQVSPNFLTRRFFLRFRPHKTLKRWKGLSTITPSLTGHALYDVWHHRIRKLPFSCVHGKRQARVFNIEKSPLWRVFWQKAFSVTVNNVWTISQSRRKNLHFQLKMDTYRIGRYSYDDGDGSENITLKIISHFFKLCRVYSSCWKYQMLVNFPVVDLLGTALKFRRDRKICRDVFESYIKRPVRDFHVVVVQWRQRNVEESVMHVQSCCFAYKPIAFFDVLVAVAVAAA